MTRRRCCTTVTLLLRRKWLMLRVFRLFRRPPRRRAWVRVCTDIAPRNLRGDCLRVTTA